MITFIIVCLSIFIYKIGMLQEVYRRKNVYMYDQCYLIGKTTIGSHFLLYVKRFVCRVNSKLRFDSTAY